jgi:1-acyl-sn-glycerol-3-phosphate acyltransferase
MLYNRRMAADASPRPTTAASRAIKPLRKLASRIQARLARRLLLVLGRGLFRLHFQFRGLENVPSGEPLIVAAAPHRNWIDPFLIVLALPPQPRIYFLGSAEGMFDTWWKRAVLAALGGVVPVSTAGQLNRQALDLSLEILAADYRLGLMPEGWGQEARPATEIQPIRRGVAFLSEHSGRRVLPVGLAGTQELWRGKTLHLQVGPPLPALAAGATRAQQNAYAAELEQSLCRILPPQPPEPEDGRKPWPWLTRLLY